MTVQDPNLAKVELIAPALEPEVRAYLRTRFAELLAAPNFMDVLPGLIFPDDSLAERTQLIATRIRVLAGQLQGD